MTYTVGCRGVVHLGGLVPGYPWEVPLSLLVFYIQKNGDSLKVENK